VTPAEVDDVLTDFAERWPGMSLSEQERTGWHNALATTDLLQVADVMPALLAAPSWPLPADVASAIRLRFHATPRARRLAYEAYKDECKRQGRPLSSKTFAAEIAAEAEAARKAQP
jgi:hypothetical protein